MADRIDQDSRRATQTSLKEIEQALVLLRGSLYHDISLSVATENMSRAHQQLKRAMLRIESAVPNLRDCEFSRTSSIQPIDIELDNIDRPSRKRLALETLVKLSRMSIPDMEKATNLMGAIENLSRADLELIASKGPIHVREDFKNYSSSELSLILKKFKSVGPECAKNIMNFVFID